MSEESKSILEQVKDKLTSDIVKNNFRGLDLNKLNVRQRNAIYNHIAGTIDDMIEERPNLDERRKARREANKK